MHAMHGTRFLREMRPASNGRRLPRTCGSLVVFHMQARAVLYLGYLQQPTVVELTVGPLPSPSNYTILREVPWNTRPPNAAEYTT